MTVLCFSGEVEAHKTLDNGEEKIMFWLAWFSLHNTAGKCPDYSLKIPSRVASNRATKSPDISGLLLKMSSYTHILQIFFFEIRT